MAMSAFTANATAVTPTIVQVVPNKSGVQWVVAQLGAETVPFRGTASTVVKLNGRYVTSSAVLPSSAGGQPYITLQSKDLLTVEFSGMTAGDQAIVTVFYVETLWGTVPTGEIVV